MSPELGSERPVGKTKDAGWQIGVSKTVPHDLDEVWDYLTSAAGLVVWLGAGVETPIEAGGTYRTSDGTTGEFRSVRPHDRVRLTWQPAGRERDATVQVALSTAASGTTIRFHTERLDDADERERMRSHWQAVIHAVESEMADRSDHGPSRDHAG